jgi:hypothetical protein
VFLAGHRIEIYRVFIKSYNKIKWFIRTFISLSIFQRKTHGNTLVNLVFDSRSGRRPTNSHPNQEKLPLWLFYTILSP